MFYPQAMDEVQIIIPEQYALPVTCALAEQGVFQQVDASYLTSETTSTDEELWRDRAAACAALERRTLALMQALDVEEGEPVGAECTTLIDIDGVRSRVERLEAEVQGIIGGLTDAQKRLEQLQSYVQELEPLVGLDVDISSLRNPRYVFSIIGVMPADNVERLQTSLQRVPFTLLTLRRDSRQAIVWLFGMQRDADILERAAKSAYLNPLSLPDAYRGTPSEAIEAIQQQIGQTEQEITEQRAEITELHEIEKEQLQELLWHVRASRLLTDAVAHFGRLRYTYVVLGWTPRAGIPGLRRQLDQISDEILIEVNPLQRSTVRSDVPVALRNPGFLRPFQQLVTVYGRPRYEEFDPTLLIALTFPLLFGAMFGDVGHGLVLALLGGLVASRKIHALRGMANLGMVLAISGVMAMVFGVLYGSVFGLEDVIPALWLHPLTSILQILITTIIAGVVLLSIAFILGIVNAWVARDWGKLLFGHTGFAGAFLYWSLLGLAAELILSRRVVPLVLLIAVAALTGIAVMFSDVLERLVTGQRPLIEGGVVNYTIQAVFVMAEVLISLLSNSLSYVRVGAFAVAHGGLSAVVFILADIASPAHGIVYWAVVIAGSLFVIGFEGLIVAIQTLRLEYYEFFGKFFAGGGADYRPFQLPTDAGA
ncbi:MAG: V-type ATP synthase subunit I [Anaerolineae bacterium]